MHPQIVICHHQAEEMLKSRMTGEPSMSVSLDLARSRIQVTSGEKGLLLDDGTLIPWTEIERVASHPKGCFSWSEGGFDELYGLSEATGWTYRLVPTKEAPALHLAGFTMHRMEGISPRQGALEMVHALGTPKGDILDTATGLGYAAIALAENGRKVTTVERDPEVRALCRRNPWSADLFTRPNIELRLGDSAELVLEMAEGTFAAILHDPPSMSLAGDLYSGAFYRELYRVLKFGGRLFHYIGDPRSAFGSGVTKGVIRRLGEAGFVKIELKPRAFGLTARKEDRFRAGRRNRERGPEKS